MHELAITQSLVDTITERTSGARATLVRLDIGKLSGVVSDAVAFCFELVADGMPLRDARLEIKEPAGRATCRSCAAEFGRKPDADMLRRGLAAQVDLHLRLRSCKSDPHRRRRGDRRRRRGGRRPLDPGRQRYLKMRRM